MDHLHRSLSFLSDKTLSHGCVNLTSINLALAVHSAFRRCPRTAIFALRNLLEVCYAPIFLTVTLTAAFVWLGLIWPAWEGVMWVLAGVSDLFQTRHAILRNYPIAAHLRFLLEGFRPEIRQYFFEGDKDGAPFPRDKRAIVYHSAKKELDKRPFGTMFDVYQEQYEWLHHSLAPKTPVTMPDLRLMIGLGGTPPIRRRY